MLPQARKVDVLVEEIGDELLVFDERRQRAHSLNTVAAKVWLACNGVRSPDQIATHCELDGDITVLALDGLAAAGLLAEPSGPAGDGEPRVSRRQILRRAALTGVGVGVALPVIRSITAPTVAMGTSNKLGNANQPCEHTSECATGSFCNSFSFDSCQRSHGQTCLSASSCSHSHNFGAACKHGHCAHSSCSHDSQCAGGRTCFSSGKCWISRP